MKYNFKESIKHGSVLSLELILLAVLVNWSETWSDTKDALIPFRDDLLYTMNPWKNSKSNAAMLVDIEAELKDVGTHWSRMHHDAEQLFGKLKKKRYHDTDLDFTFNVRYIPDNEYVEDVQEIVTEHDSNEDDLWDGKIWKNDVYNLFIGKRDALMEHAITFNKNPAIMERRYHLEWVNTQIGYGVVASVNFEPQEILDLYTGDIACASVVDNSYRWVHPSLKPTAKSCSIDAKASGNLMRFVNDDRNYHNVNYLKIIFNGKHYIVYSTMNKPIMKGNHLSVSYGAPYWRKKVQCSLLEL